MFQKTESYILDFMQIHESIVWQNSQYCHHVISEGSKKTEQMYIDKNNKKDIRV